MYSLPWKLICRIRRRLNVLCQDLINIFIYVSSVQLFLPEGQLYNFIKVKGPQINIQTVFPGPIRLSKFLIVFDHFLPQAALDQMEVRSACHGEKQPPHRTTVPRGPVDLPVEVLQMERQKQLCLLLQLQQTPHLMKHLIESFKQR